MVHAKFKVGDRIRRRGDQAIGVIKLVTVTHGIIIYAIDFPEGEKRLTEASLIPVEVETRFTGKS